MQIDILALISRVLHILAAITAVGGAVFMRFAWLPSSSALGEGERKELQDQLRPRWSLLLQAAILFLILSGTYNFVAILMAARTPGWESWRANIGGLYHGLFGVKLLLAIAIFALASILAGRSAGTEKFRANAKFWLNVNLALALAVVIVSAVMRQTHMGPTLPAATAAPTAGGDGK